MSHSDVPTPSPRVPAPPIVCPNLIEPDKSDEPDPGPSQPRQPPHRANSQQCFPYTKSIFVDATRYLLASEARRQFNSHVVIDNVTGQSLEYCHLIRGPNADVWSHNLANNCGRLAQGVGMRMPTGTKTVFFIRKCDVPAGRTFTYSHLVSKFFPQKTETHRFRVTVGSDKLDFSGIITTNCSSLKTTKCLLNSIVSTPNARFLTLDINNFYYNNPMSRYKYMKIALDIVPDKIIRQYNLCALASNGWVYM